MAKSKWITKEAKWTFWAISFTIFFIFFLVFMLGPLWSITWGPIGYQFHYSEGERSGQVIKFSAKGILWKTWEGTMGLTQSGAYIDYWDFSVDNTDPDKEALVADIRTALTSGNLINVVYDQRLSSPPWHGDTPYFVKEIKTFETKYK